MGLDDFERLQMLQRPKVSEKINRTMFQRFMSVFRKRALQQANLKVDPVAQPSERFVSDKEKLKKRFPDAFQNEVLKLSEAFNPYELTELGLDTGVGYSCPSVDTLEDAEEIEKRLVALGYVCKGRFGYGPREHGNVIPDEGSYPGYSLAKNPPHFQFRIVLYPEDVVRSENGGYEDSQRGLVERDLRNHLQKKFLDIAHEDPRNFVMNAIPNAEDMGISVHEDYFEQLREILESDDFQLSEDDGDYSIVDAGDYKFVHIQNLYDIGGKYEHPSAE